MVRDLKKAWHKREPQSGSDKRQGPVIVVGPVNNSCR